MKITHQKRGNTAVLSLRGDLSIDEAKRFRQEALQQIEDDVRDFVLDFEQLDLIDSRGLETLLWLQDQCAEILGQVRIAACSDPVKKVFEVTRLTARFECHEDIDTALQSLEQPGA